MKFKKDPKKHIYRYTDQDLIEVFKVLGNTYRTSILFVIEKYPKITLDQINQLVGGDIKNISAHVKRMSVVQLIHKKYLNNFVQHTLTDKGKTALKAIRLFDIHK